MVAAVTADDTQTIRDALRSWCNYEPPMKGSRGASAVAALDRLAAENDRLTRERDEARETCEKAIRERRSLEQKEDDWHSAYERKGAENERLRAALTKARAFIDLNDPFDPPDSEWQQMTAEIDAALAGGVGDTAAPTRRVGTQITTILDGRASK